jgi:hypothetical protein
LGRWLQLPFFWWHLVFCFRWGVPFWCLVKGSTMILGGVLKFRGCSWYVWFCICPFDTLLLILFINWCMIDRFFLFSLPLLRWVWTGCVPPHHRRVPVAWTGQRWAVSGVHVYFFAVILLWNWSMQSFKLHA